MQKFASAHHGHRTHALSEKLKTSALFCMGGFQTLGNGHRRRKWLNLLLPNHNFQQRKNYPNIDTFKAVFIMLNSDQQENWMYLSHQRDDAQVAVQFNMVRLPKREVRNKCTIEDFGVHYQIATCTYKFTVESIHRGMHHIPRSLKPTNEFMN